MSQTPEASTTFESGAKRSAVGARFDLMPREALDALTRRLTLGAAKYGEHNWQKAVNDPAFKRDIVNHLIEHVLDYQQHGNEFEANTDAIIANAAFLAYFEDPRIRGNHFANMVAFDAVSALAATKPASPVRQLVTADGAIEPNTPFINTANGHTCELSPLPTADEMMSEIYRLRADNEQLSASCRRATDTIRKYADGKLFTKKTVKKAAKR